MEKTIRFIVDVLTAPVATFIFGYGLMKTDNTILGITVSIAALIMLIFEFISYFSKGDKE